MKATAKTRPNPPINLHKAALRPLEGEEEKLKSSALLEASATTGRSAMGIPSFWWNLLSIPSNTAALSKLPAGGTK